ncbi:MAG TPA: hypothetical protein VG710_06160 [Opitutus sp.]|nr:hypothetical protein [Opitutus sp.]
MNSTPATTPEAAAEWDRIRASFAASIMVNTPLASLAQALEGADWPIASADETPAVYIDFTYDELLHEFAARRLPKFAPLLIRILRETLEFDQPFGDMVAQTEAAATRDNPILRSLARLDIPEDYPIDLVTLDVPSRDLCQLEQLSTLGQLAVFAQGLAQNVILGGALRRLLNALAQADERQIAVFVPFRPGSAGLHLVEALAHAALSTEPARQVGRTLAWFSTDCRNWRAAAATDPDFISHELQLLGDRALEQQIKRLLAPHIVSALPNRYSQWWSAFARWKKA